jgi:hypothetical protein
VIDLGCSLAYQFATALSSDMMNDFVRVVSSLPDKAITASLHMRNLRGSDLPYILVEVLLCIGAAMVPAVNCQSAGICCQWYLPPKVIGAAAVAVMGPAATGVAKVKALILRARALADEELQWPAVAQLALLSLAQSAAAA